MFEVTACLSNGGIAVKFDSKPSYKKKKNSILIRERANRVF